MSQSYGVKNDNAKYIHTMRVERLQPFSTEGFPSNYTKVHLEDNDVLCGVVSNLECMPNLAVWSKHEWPFLVSNRQLTPGEFLGTVMPYILSMTDDEHQIIYPQIHYLSLFAKIHSVKGYDHTVEICMTVGGVGRTLLLTVMNMMEPTAGLDNCRVRDTLN